MAAYTPPIPFVATREMLIDWFHREFAPTGCGHPAEEVWECVSWAERLLESGVVKDGGEFLSDLKENPTVQGVIGGYLSDSWEQGKRAGKSIVMRRMSDERDAPEPVNPYGE